jgi:general secretion pathway protein M
MSQSASAQLRESFDAFWEERTLSERRMLTLCALFVGAVLVYLILFAPALKGRVEAEKNLPQLHQEAAQMQALLAEAKQYASQAAPSITPMTKDSLEAMLTQRGLPPATIAVTSDFAKVQLSNIPFATLASWLGEVQKIHRISVLDANIVPQATLGNVNATLTLKQLVQ